jgi:hypothetical protein
VNDNTGEDAIEDYLQSEWSAFENILVQTLDPVGRQRRFLPVLLVHCEPPLRIGILIYIDLTRSEEHAQGVERLRVITSRAIR